MARSFPERNFLGVDIKGARMWKGAKEAHNDKLHNVGFIRTRIELIESFFSKGEISEIWITFPDPQIKKRRNKKRLTASRFLNTYNNFLVKDGLVHLKTDSIELYSYTNRLLLYNNIIPEFATDNLYSGSIENELLNIKTHYELLFLKEGKNITYTRFKPGNRELKELPEDGK
jgi:tRNA (guanine-N7-)-methyltransferase